MKNFLRRICMHMQIYFLHIREILIVFSRMLLPLVIACIAALVFYKPGQMLEVYRSFAIDIAVYELFIEKNQDVLILSLFCLLSLSMLIYISARFLHRYSSPEIKLQTTSGKFSAYLFPLFFSALPILALAGGVSKAYIPEKAQTEFSKNFIEKTLIEELGAGETRYINKLFDGTLNTALQDAYCSLMLIGLGYPLLFLFLSILFRWGVGYSMISKKIITYIIVFGIILAIFALLWFGLSISLYQRSIPQSIGSVTILCLFFILLTLIFSSLNFISRKFQFPITTLVLVYVVLLSWLGLNDNHEIRKIENVSADKEMLPSIDTAFKEWLDARSQRIKKFVKPKERQKTQTEETNYAREGKKKYPIYIVAAQGGGIYAAHHTATALANLKKKIPVLSDHLFAISSVSGGSFGAAVYANGLHLDNVLKIGENQSHHSKLCKKYIRTLSPKVKSKGFDFVNFVDDYALAPDFWSPIASAISFPDFLQRFIPKDIPEFDRARALEHTLENSWDTGTKEYANLELGLEPKRLMELNKALESIRNFLREPYICHWSSTGVVPALIINTTEVNTGKRRIFSPFSFGAINGVNSRLKNLGKAKSQQNITSSPNLYPTSLMYQTRLSTAAVVSARFPWITPTGWYRKGEAQSKIRLVDGGYFDNSGVVTALQLRDAMLEVLKKDPFYKENIEIKVIVLSDAVVSEGNNKKNSSNDNHGFSELGDPLRTLISTWRSRASFNINQAEKKLNRKYSENEDVPLSEKTLLRLPLSELYHPLPLGWTLSISTRWMIRIQAGDPERCKDGIPENQKKGEFFHSDCVVQVLMKSTM